MVTTMNDEQARIKREKRNAAKRAIASALGLLSILVFFIPYVSYSFSGSTYVLSGLQIVTAAGLQVDGYIVSVPVAAKISAAAGVVFSALGIMLLLLLKKPILAGISFVFSSLTTLVVLLTGSAVQAALTSINISQINITYSWNFAFILVCGLMGAILSVWTQGTEKLAQAVFLVFACVSVGSVILITGYMIYAGAPAISQIGLGKFLFGMEWKPSSNVFGIFPLIVSSFAGTAGAILIGVPVGILTAVFLSETADPKLAKIVRPAVELLAGIPSVIYGFFGMIIIVPFIRELFPGQTIGDSLLAVIIILAIMVLPTIVNVSETSLRAVPQSYREASLALGATPTATIFKVTVPAAKSGILAGVILGVGRAIGETMAVIMVAGNIVQMPTLLGTVRLLTTGIVMEMNYASGLHRQALFAIGLVLFVFIMIVNISFTYISKKGVQMSDK